MKFVRRTLQLALFVFPFAASALSMNDISVLLPLPNQQENKQMISTADEGSKGSLLPRSVYNRLPNLLPDTRPDTVYKELLKVVAVRIDPCFTEGVGPQACRRQIRMIWQPIISDGVETFTRDAAAHSFYEFTNDAEWNALMKEWTANSNVEEALPLQVHPTMVSEGYSGKFWTTFKAIILKYCGSQNLIRATAMNVMNGEQVWIFAGVHVDAQLATTPITIPRINRTSQGVIMGINNTDEFTGSIRPAAMEDPELEALVQDSISMRKNEAEIKKLMGRIYEYENPKLNNPGTLDCVSCHVSQSARVWGQGHFKGWDWLNEFKTQAYKSDLNIDNKSTTPFKSNHFRAFGYFYDQAMISQRVINETAETALTLKTTKNQ